MSPYSNHHTGRPGARVSLRLLALALAGLPFSGLLAVVNTPVFTPTAGSSIAELSVVVTCSTPGASIHYTLTGAEPTQFDPVVASGGAVTVDRYLTLKAKAWTTSESSSVVSADFKVTGDISAGSKSLIALSSKDVLLAWGKQDYGRLSNGINSSTAIVAPSAMKYNANSPILNGERVDAGANHTVVLDTSGDVWAAGNNAYGEAGNTIGGTRLFVGRVTTGSGNLTGCTEVAAGLDFSAALESGGFVRTWGRYNGGRLGGGSLSASRHTALRVKTSQSVELSGIRDIALGAEFGIAREANAIEVPGALGKVWVWGTNTSAMMTTGNTTNQNFAIKLKSAANTDLTDAWDIAGGDGHIAIVRWKTGDANLEGTVWTTGSTANGRLGNNNGAVPSGGYPVKVVKSGGVALTKIIQVAAGPAHTIALDNEGKVWAWGSNFHGALGDTTTTDRAYAVPVKDPDGPGQLSNIVRISAGGITGSINSTNGSFSAAVARDGTIYVWGTNNEGVMANGTTSNSPKISTPLKVNQIKTLPGFPSISLAHAVTALNDPGSVTLTATATDPQGDGTVDEVEFFLNGTSRMTKTDPPWNTNLTGLAEGSYHAYAVAKDNDGNRTYSLPLTFVIEETVDGDQDGLLDSWELLHFGNLSQTASGDPDGDTVSNAHEQDAGTNPNANLDANSDGLPDDWVSWQLSLPGGVAASILPPVGDPDGDELTTLVEFQQGTWPRHFDSDSDGQSDWQELAQETDPKDAGSLAPAVEVSAHKGTTGLIESVSLANPVTGLGYDLALTGNYPQTEGYEMKASNQAGGPAYAWIEISSTGELLSDFSSDPDTLLARAIPFEFSFYGVEYEDLYISSNGFLTFTDQGDWDGFPYNFRNSLPNATTTMPLLAPYMQYLDVDLQGNVYFQAFTDHVVVQWEQVKVSNQVLQVTFQAVIYQDGSIRFNYKSIPTNQGGANVVGYLTGIQNETGDNGIGVAWYSGSHQGMAVHSLDPLSLRFAAPTVSTPWVGASTAVVSGDPLSWDLSFHGADLQPGLHEAQLTLAKTGGPALYTRAIKLTVLPLGTTGSDTITGTSGNDSLQGLDGSDTITGHAGNDSLDGGAGDDTITGGTGDDTLLGGDGKDVYHYNLGDGHDYYSDNAGIHQANDLTADYSDLHFGPDITPGMLRSYYLPADGTHATGWLKFEVVDEAGGSITINDWNMRSGSTNVYTSKRWRFHFADGTVWSGSLFWNEDLSMPFQGFTGGISPDLLTGSEGAEGMRGLEGDDLLLGGAGSDTYYYQWGSGHDTIDDSPGTGNLSTLNIQGVDLATRLTYDFIEPKDLLINVSHPSDGSRDGSILIRGWYDTYPIQFKDNWRINAQNAAGTWIDVSQAMRYMATDGPDTINGLATHTGNGQTFDSGAGNDSIRGSFWAETLLGNLGDDFLYGEAGDDTLEGGDGDDMLYGGSNNDTLRGQAGSDTLNGDAGNDSLHGGDGEDTLYGGTENDVLEGGAADDVLNGGDGNDTMRGGTGNDELNGGIGSDTYEWNLGDGFDSITDSTSDLVSSAENHLVFGTGVDPAQVRLITEPGSNSLAFSIRDTQDEEIGRVTIHEWFTKNLITFGTGNHAKSWRILFTGDPTIWNGAVLATPGADQVTGTTGDDSLQGSTGDDTLQGLDGADTLAGEDGNDLLEGGEGNDDLSGGSGRDSLAGGGGSDALSGGDGSDSISGGAGDDQLDGGLGNDTLEGGGGSDIYQWAVGDGNDTLIEYISSIGNGDLNTVSFSGEVAPGVEISNQFVKVTSSGQDYGFLTVLDPSGNQLAVLTVRNWNDSKGTWRILFPGDVTPSHWNTLQELATPDLDGVYDSESGGSTAGSDYNDYLAGGTGNDILDGGEGDDQIAGLAGSDVIYGGTGSDILSGGEGDDKLGGGSDADIIRGGDGKDSIDGGNHDDILTGGAGNDTIAGGAGNDLLDGQEGSDVLQGGTGNDRLRGGPGDDFLSGDQGADTYEWNLGDGNDTIVDTAGDNEESLEVNVVLLGPGIDLQHLVQEVVPAGTNQGASLKVTILDGSGQPAGSISAVFPNPSNSVSDLGVKLRTSSGKDIPLATPGKDVLRGNPESYTEDSFVVDALGGDDDIRTFDGDDTVRGGEGNDTISCGDGQNIITGGPGNDLIISTRIPHRVIRFTDMIHWNIGDGHDRIINGMLDLPANDFERIQARLKFGPVISPEDCSFEVIENRAKNTASFKVIVHDSVGQVIGSVSFEGVFEMNYGAGYEWSVAAAPLTEYLRLGFWKSWIEEADIEIEFADSTLWELNTRGYAGGGGSIDRLYQGRRDTDRDGIDDGWEILHGLDPLYDQEWNEEYEGDPDEDGLSNLQEYVERKNPNVPDADPPLVLENTGNDQDIMSIAYENQNGLNNSIDDSMDDKDGDGFPNGWEYIRGTRADNPNDLPEPDYIVDQDNGELSITDNIVTTLGEAANLANLKRSAHSSYSERTSIIEVRAGTYLESVRFDQNVLIYGKAGANGEPPAVVSPEEGQTLSFGNDLYQEWPDSFVAGIRISHVSGQKGPAIHSEEELYLSRVVIDHNVSDYGAAVYGRVARLEHCTVFNNTSPGGIYLAAWGAPVTIRNSILWGNSDPALMAQGHYGNQDPVAYTVEDSIIQGGFMGALNTDPLLHRSGSLTSGSPAINALTPPSGSLETPDIHGEGRTADGLSDIGADEYRDDNATSDGDGIPDWVELASDADSLGSAAEYGTHLTDPYLTDTDFDGLADDAEILTHLTNPLSADTDGDGITDGNEIRIGTSPIVANNDGDSLPDEWEFDHGLNPNTDDSGLDLDGDGLTNGQEHGLGTDPGEKDSDGDGMSDDWEVANGQDPAEFTPTPLTVLADGDSDGMTGWAEIMFGSSDEEADTESDGLSDAFEFSGGTTATLVDSDGDGTPDIDEDSDGDGLSNRDELETHATSPVSKDTDGDGIGDFQEVSLQMNPNDPDDGEADGDADGLNKSKELQIGTNPGLADSDEDGIPDGLEYGGGLDPLDPDSDSDSVLDLDEDTDGDGLTNRVELGQSTHMLYRDTDLDGTDDTLAN